VLDHAAAVGQIERIVGERQPLAGVGLDERARVVGPGIEVDPRDVELWGLGDQATAARAEIEDPCLRSDSGLGDEPS